MEENFVIIRDDVYKTLRSLPRQGLSADIIFFDPPYDWKHYADLLELAFKPGLALSHTCVVIEHGRKAILPESGEEYVRYRLVRQGDNRLSFYKKQSKV